MSAMQMKLIDIVIDCPICGERIALPAVAVTPRIVTDPGGTYVTAVINDIPNKEHNCGVLHSRVTLGGSMLGPVNTNAYADAKGNHGPH